MGKQGLEHRYDVQRVNDTEGKHDNCRYFVLDPHHDIFALQALKYYSQLVRQAEPKLSADLKEWTDQETENWVDGQTPR